MLIKLQKALEVRDFVFRKLTRMWNVAYRLSSNGFKGLEFVCDGNEVRYGKTRRAAKNREASVGDA